MKPQIFFYQALILLFFCPLFSLAQINSDASATNQLAVGSRSPMASTDPLDTKGLKKMHFSNFLKQNSSEEFMIYPYYDQQLQPIHMDFVFTPYYIEDMVYLDAENQVKGVSVRKSTPEEEKKIRQADIEDRKKHGELPDLSHPVLKGLMPAHFFEVETMLDRDVPKYFGENLTPLSDDQYRVLMEQNIGVNDPTPKEYTLIQFVAMDDPEIIKETKVLVVWPLSERQKIQYAQVREFSSNLDYGSTGASSNQLVADASLGSIAPNFSVTDLEGRRYTLDNLKGKVVVLNFWFIGCHPCVAEMPSLNELKASYENNSNVVFLAMGRDDLQKVKDFLMNVQKFDYTIIPNAIRVAESYQIYAYPTHLVLDKNSKIILREAGGSDIILENLKRKIEEALNQ